MQPLKAREPFNSPTVKGEFWATKAYLEITLTIEAKVFCCLNRCLNRPPCKWLILQYTRFD